MSTIRPAEPQDARIIADIYVETWRTSYAGMVPDQVLIDLSPSRITTSWNKAIRRGHDRILVARDRADTVIGFGSAGPNRERANRFDGEIYTLYVHPDFQNRGTGRSLLHALFDALAAGGYQHCMLWVLAANPSRFFYHAMGGKICGEKSERLWGTDLLEFAYAWENIHALQHSPPK